MIRIDVKPRSDNKFDIYVTDDNGTPLLNSSQGYANVEDAEWIVRRLFGRVAATGEPQTVALRVEYRNGKTKTEQLR
ncbi:hypothetical protein [Mycobacterium sp. NPDC050041]|uniref:hypothetical protein n=1 Tax=Mycobacterium sp. NPDC050041 TaxID=3364293 RepID=UPI003C2CE18C